MVKEDGPHVIQMSIERKQTSASLVAPDLDLVVIAARNEQWLGFVEVNASNGSIVFFEAINECSHAVVP
jgi:hypothetical protein